MINLLWLHSDWTGCGTYRCYIPALTLEEQGYDNNFLLHSGASRADFERLGDMHIAVFQRATSPLFLSWMQECKRIGVAVVYEMDDDLFHVSDRNPAGAYWNNKATQKLLQKQLALADHIIVSTDPLRDVVRYETGRDRDTISVCPNHLHPRVWGDANFQGRALTPNIRDGQRYKVIGWQGSNTHNSDFAVAVPALERIVKEREDVVVRFMGNVPTSVRGHIPEHSFQWSRGVEMHLYPTTLRFLNFDIGIAPVTNTKFNRAKSNLKWLEYAALGVPCVASRVYPYERSIEDGKTGLLAGTTQEWYDALTVLLDSADLRHQIGTTVKQHVWQTWGPARSAAWKQVFEQLRGDGAYVEHRGDPPQLDGAAGAEPLVHEHEAL